MNFKAKREERRRRAMREVLAAACRLRDRLMEMSGQSVWGWGPAGENVWSERRLREEVRRLWELRRRMLEEAPAGVFGEGCPSQMLTIDTDAHSKRVERRSYDPILGHHTGDSPEIAEVASDDGRTEFECNCGNLRVVSPDVRPLTHERGMPVHRRQRVSEHSPTCQVFHGPRHALVDQFSSAVISRLP